MATKTKKKNLDRDTSTAGSGKMLAFRTNNLMEEQLAWFAEYWGRREMQKIERPEAARRLLAAGIAAKQREIEKLGELDDAAPPLWVDGKKKT